MRPGKTTAVGVQAALAGARAVSPRIVTAFVDLGGKDLWSAALGRRSQDGSPVKDDFEEVLVHLRDPQLAGLIIGSPSYYRTMSAQCKMFLERCAVLREPTQQRANKVVGVLAVGGYRNGGQELVIQQILTAMLSYGMVPVGGNAPAMLGGTLWSQQDSVAQDEVGLKSAALLGAHVAEIALKLS